MENQTQHILDTDQANFVTDVIEASHNQLVLVDFWAEWCGPCRSLGPILEQLVADYQGAIRLVKVNADTEQGICSHYGIRSLPTVYLFSEGQVVDQFMGLQPESEIKKLIDQHTGNPSSDVLTQIQGAYAQGYVDQAIEALRQLIAQESSGESPDPDPKSDQLKTVLMNYLAEQNQIDEAKSVAESVSDEGKNTTEYKQFEARLSFSETGDEDVDMDQLKANIEANPKDLASRLALANQLVLQQQYTGALDQLLEIVRIDREFNDQIARQTMIKIFELLGGHGEIVSNYRRQLARTLH